MTDERLAELERLCAAATAGPWFRSANWYIASRKDASVYTRSFPGARDDYVLAQVQGPSGFNNDAGADFAFIVAARTAVPELLAEVRRLRECCAKTDH